MSLITNINDLNLLNQRIFGYIGRPFPLGNLDAINPHESSKNLMDAYFGKTVLGKSFFMPVTVDGYSLPGVNINISGGKKIIKTLINEKKGTDKEFFATDDYKITLRGVASNLESNDFPEADLDKIYKMYEKNEALSIKCVLTDIIKVYSVVIETFKFPEMKGVDNAQAYVLNCISDADYIVDENDDFLNL